MDQSTGKLSLGQKFFLILGMPLLLLGALEAACRIFSIDSRLSNKSASIELEMPAWMEDDDNQSARTAAGTFNREMVDWLSIFEEGSGYRVRLIPGIEKAVTNTFSQLPQDKENKYLVKANSLGFRGPEVSERKAPGVYRIIIFGDSSSFGWGVNQDETFSALLPRTLSQKSGLHIEVANFAIPGDSSEYGRLVFETFGPRYDADLMILGFGANDAKKTYFSHQSQVDKFRSSRGAQKLKSLARASAFYRALEALIGGRPKIDRANLPEQENAVPQKRFAENLKSMAETARQKGARTLLLSLCTPSNYARRAEDLAQENGYIYLNGQTYLRKMIPEIERGAVFPDTLNEMRASYGHNLDQNSLFYVTSDACHPNKIGHQLIAEKIAEEIIAARILPGGKHDT